MKELLQKWLYAAPDIWLMIALSAIGIYAAVILFTRIAGLRSFSKMSSFDFAMTVAIGSIIASTVITKTPLLQGLVGLAAVYLLQMGVALLRRLDFIKKAVDNKPVLLMKHGVILEENLRKVRLAKEDLYAKMREANVYKHEQVLAAIMETTGDVSILHSDEAAEIDEAILADVQE